MISRNETPIQPLPSTYQLDLGEFPASCGFPNPCDDYISKRISLDDIMINRPSSTFLFKATGKSMQPTIPDGSILVVDKSVDPVNGSIVLAVIDGDFVVKELILKADSNQLIFRSHNESVADYVVNRDEYDCSSNTMIWGCVTGFLKRF